MEVLNEDSNPEDFNNTRPYIIGKDTELTYGQEPKVVPKAFFDIVSWEDSRPIDLSSVN